MLARASLFSCLPPKSPQISFSFAQTARILTCFENNVESSATVIASMLNNLKNAVRWQADLPAHSFRKTNVSTTSRGISSSCFVLFLGMLIFDTACLFIYVIIDR